MLKQAWQKFSEQGRQLANTLWRRYLQPDYEQFKDRYGTFLAGGGDWLAGLSPEIHTRMKIGGMFSLILLGYLLLWAPLSAVLEEVESAHQQNARTLSYLRERPPVYSDSGGQNLATSLINSARSSGIVFSQFQPGANETASIAIEGVGFTLLLSWLENLERLGVARIDTLIINASEDDQNLIVRLTLVGL